ncbi:MAG: glutamate-5-semialdehyde dehydrogenase, partial [Endomicrobiia bacterium]
NFLVQIINKSINNVLRRNKLKLPTSPVLFINNTSYDLMYSLLKLENYIDLIIPRGGEKMIQNIKSKSLIPVLSHGSGVCHAYVDEFADIDKSLKVCLNAKVQRPSVCNAIEKLLVHKNIAKKFLPLIAKKFLDNKVKLIGCKRTKQLLQKHNIKVQLAKEDDWYKEYLDLIITIKIVNSLEEAILHINKYGSHHSEMIMSESGDNQKKFVQETDSSAVFINSSTRLHDGGVFGFGTEIGISTSKLHARGTMGLKELSTTKYIVLGDGNVRE